MVTKSPIEWLLAALAYFMSLIIFDDEIAFNSQDEYSQRSYRFEQGENQMCKQRNGKQMI